MSPFEARARAEKVTHLVDALEHLAAMTGADLTRWQTYRRLAVHAWEHMTAKDWVALANEARTRPPSDDQSVRAVVDRLVAIGVERAFVQAHGERETHHG